VAKPLADFYYRDRAKGWRSTYCKPCTRAYEAERYGSDHRKQQVKARAELASQRNKDLLWDYLLGHPCVDCGEGDPVVLEFDHLQPREALCVTSMLNHAYRWETILAEIAKCEVVCSSCHTRRTLRRAGSWKIHKAAAMKLAK
jgi:hypothetical protein